MSRSTKDISLKRELKPRQLFMMGFGTIVGVGWIVALGGWLSGGGSLGAIIAFLVGGAMISIIALCYGGLARKFPYRGGEIIYAYELFGEGAAFSVGWLLILVYCATVAFEAISLGWVMQAIIPGLDDPLLYNFLGAQVGLTSLGIALVIMLIIALVNYAGAGTAAKFQEATTLLFILCAVVFIGAGLLRGDVQNLEPFFVGESRAETIDGILFVLATAPFWFGGFAMVAQAFGEMPEEQIRSSANRLLLLIVGAAGFFYVLVILATAMVAPRIQTLSADLPAAAAFRIGLQSEIMARMVLFVGFVGLVTTWNAVFFAATRVLFSLSKAGLLPSSLGALSAKQQTPSMAILAVFLVGTVGTLMGRGAIWPIVHAAGTCLAIIYFMVCAAALRQGWHTMRSSEQESGWVTAKAIPIGGMVASIILLVGSVIDLVSGRGLMQSPEILIIGIWIVLGLVFWLAGKKCRHESGNTEERKRVLRGSGNEFR